MNDSHDHLNNIHHDFSKSILSENLVLLNAIDQFNKWLKEAIAAKVNEPSAMVISTVSANCSPSSRVVFLRDTVTKGLIFYTNYQSRKAKEIEHNPHACANFFWPELERQVRVEGLLIKLSAAKSDHYFNNRPRGSKIGAWASAQSAVLANRNELEHKYAELEKQFENNEIPRPEFWGGYCLQPSTIEFWQGRPSRLHDRLLYTTRGKDWKIERLSP